MALLGLSDEVLGIILPLFIFWGYAGFYEVISLFTGKYRLFPREEEDKMNVVSRWDAIKGVLLNQAFQTTFSFLFVLMQGRGGPPRPQPPLYVQAVQVLVAMVVLDGWQYFGHRLFHTNQFLYKHVHALHHLLVVPYAFGAQYQHPVEAFFVDTLGAAAAYVISGMTPRTAIFFFCMTFLKSVDDHCGLCLPGNPFHLIFSNNSAFHTVHHQLYGGKANFSSPYFTFWDKLMGTYMPYTLEKREGDGYELKPVKED